LTLRPLTLPRPLRLPGTLPLLAPTTSLGTPYPPWHPLPLSGTPLRLPGTPNASWHPQRLPDIPTPSWNHSLTTAPSSARPNPEVSVFALTARKHWWDLAQNELAAALNVRDNWNVAKNVIIFLGDGMGITANTAARIFKGQKKGMNGEEGYMTWERFPNAALLKTYNVDKQVPDSAGTATAYLCGVKANYYTLGVDSEVTLGDCAAARNPIYHTPSILQWAQEAGKDTGFVTTTRVTHATPAALYAHSAHRNWECDGNLGQMGIGCKDIADQLVSENPGRNIKVILGGGRQSFGASTGPVNKDTCIRRDGRDLTREWLSDKAQQGHSAAYVTNAGELANVDVDDTDFLLAGGNMALVEISLFGTNVDAVLNPAPRLFSDTHVPFEVDRVNSPAGSPSLTQMATKAVKFLQKNDNGFFLLVRRCSRQLRAAASTTPCTTTCPPRPRGSRRLDSAVAAVLEEVDLEDTLVLVTADHSHVMTINGYPERGNDILGMTGDISKIDNMPYTTLMFTNGPGFNYTTDGSRVIRQDPRTVDTRHVNYRSQAAVPLPPISETHGGEDVGVWAAGPMAHLFHRTHEQHYVAHVMAYAACVGPSAGKSAAVASAVASGHRGVRTLRRTEIPHVIAALTSSQRRPSSCAESRVRGQPRPPNYVSDRDDLRLRVCVQLHLSRRRPDAPGAECAPAPQHVVRQLRGAAATPLPV
ncbi:putative alkaline phosphatase, partial [Penaeus vannamei]